MCEPTTIVMAVSAVVGIATAAYSAQQQKKAVEQAAAVQQKQIDDSASAEKEDRIRAARDARSQARAAAAEAGIAGGSVDALLNDAFMQSGRDVSRIEKNRQNGVDASNAEASGRIRTSNAEAIGQIVNSATDFYTDYSKASIAKSNLTITG